MDYIYIDPPKPTLARWRRLYRDFPGNSDLRAMEYETLSAMPLTGRVLDVGGGRKARYMPVSARRDRRSNW